MQYTVKYFINKFEKIPDKDWGVESLENHCALFHCGVRNAAKQPKHSLLLTGGYEPTPEAKALIKIFGGTKDTDFASVYRVNDGINTDVVGETAKERILNCLKEKLKKGK